MTSHQLCGLVRSPDSPLKTLHAGELPQPSDCQALRLKLPCHVGLCLARRESGRSALVERPGEWLNNNGIVAKTYETPSDVGKSSRRC